MSTQLLIGNKTRPKIGVLELDCSISETHTYNSEISAYPVEDGSVITDHIRNLPERLSISGFITNNPVVQVQSSDITGEETVGNFVNLAFEEIQKIRNNREPVDIVTGLKVYSNMALESLTIPRSASIGDTFRFDANFVEIKIVNTETVVIPNVTEDVADTAASTADNGKQSTSEASDEQTESVSFLKQAANWLKKKAYPQ